MLTLALPEGELPVILLRRVRKSIALRVRGNALEVVAHPQVPLDFIRQLLAQRHDWIRSQWQCQQALLAARARGPQSIWLMGRELPVVFAGGARVRLVFAAEELRVFGLAADGAVDVLQAAMARALKARATLAYPARLAAFTPRLSRQPTGWQLSSARSRWGSCTAVGMIRLNWRLIQAPPEVLDYVMAHELAHLVHLNHSPAFWAEVSRILPAWQTARDWLKAYGNQLFNLG
ncbi:M48 family metallopeptidase [Craterilacuibacter sp.]|uniref:M48 family metallopeptidase n=1 Tax=Craterilacuibacter sp. TaxID=2870909 RepID=UPI003F37492A